MAAGLTEALFWQCTPKQLALHFESIGLKAQREHNARAWLAWHVAALTRAKKFPRLDTLLAKTKTAPRRQTWEEQMVIMQAWSERVNRRAAKQDQNIIG